MHIPVAVGGHAEDFLDVGPFGKATSTSRLSRDLIDLVLKDLVELRDGGGLEHRENVLAKVAGHVVTLVSGSTNQSIVNGL